MKAIETLLARAVEKRASDLHLVSGEVPRVRVVGELHPLDAPATSSDALDEILVEVAPEALREDMSDDREIDFSYADATGRRYRVSAFRERRGLAIAFRVLAGRPPTLEELGLPGHIRRCVYAQGGLVLFAGHAGSGKTTTMASVLQELCDRRQARLLTIEDPIEYRLDAGQAWLEQRAVGRHCRSFAKGVSAAFDAAPDAIAIGELRDLETMRTALQAAETGVLVFATVHAYDATRAIGRIVDAFSLDERPAARLALSATLSMIVAQTLLRKADGSGRVPGFEIVQGTTSLGTLIREGKEHELSTVVESSRSRGMCLLDDSIVELARRGTVSREEALFFAVHKDNVAHRLA